MSKARYYCKQLVNLFNSFLRIFFLPKAKSVGVILYGNNFDNGGANNVYLSILKTLVENDIDVACFSRDYGYLRDSVDKLSTITICNYRGTYFFRKLYKKGYNKIVLNVVSTFNVSKELKSIGFHLIGLLHENIDFVYGKYKLDILDAVQHCDYVFVPSQVQYYKMLELYPEHKDKIMVMFFDTFYEKNMFNEKNNQKPYVLSVSGHSPKWKGFDIFLSIAKSFESQQLTFIWIGSADDNILNAFSLKYNGIPKNLRLIKPVLDHKEVLEYVNGAFAVISCSKSETFGLTILDALALGIPVIMSSVMGGISFDLENEKNSILLPSLEGCLFEEALNKLINDSSLREKIVRGTIEFIKKYRSNKIINSIVLEWVRV